MFGDAYYRKKTFARNHLFQKFPFPPVMGVYRPTAPPLDPPLPVPRYTEVGVLLLLEREERTVTTLLVCCVAGGAVYRMHLNTTQRL